MAVIFNKQDFLSVTIFKYLKFLAAKKNGEVFFCKSFTDTWIFGVVSSSGFQVLPSIEVSIVPATPLQVVFGA